MYFFYNPFPCRFKTFHCKYHYPQVILTVRSLIEEFRDRIDFEILAIDNWCPDMNTQEKKPDRSGEVIAGSVRANAPYLKYLIYADKLSHWNAKNVGIKYAQENGSISWTPMSFWTAAP